MGIRNELILPIAQFLAHVWSENNDINVILSPNINYSYTFINESIFSPTLDKFPSKDITIAYRLWRTSLWHQAMHVLLTNFWSENFIDYYDSFYRLSNYLLISNIIEDYRIEEEGIKLYPGMEKELKFSKAIYYHLANTPNNIIEAYIQAMNFGAIKNIDKINKEWIKRVTKAVKYTKNALKKGKNIFDIAHNVCNILGIEENENLDFFITKLFSKTSKQKISESQLKEIVENWIKEKSKFEEKLIEEKAEFEEQNTNLTSNIGEVSEIEIKKSKENLKDIKEIIDEILKIDNIIKEELELINLEEKKLERGLKGIESKVIPRIIIPDRLEEDEQRYYDIELINHLKSQLRNLKKGWKEVYSYTGEFDLESYISKNKKFFIDEERIKIGGYKVIILLDHSSSIYGHHYNYKKCCIALAEALSELNIDFSIFAFTEYRERETGHRYTCVYLIKSFEEKWTKINARRLAQIQPFGGTPLADVYKILKPLVLRTKGKIIFITLTDGEPAQGTENECRKVINSLKKYCDMIAIAFGYNMKNVMRLIENLKNLEYTRYIALDDVRKLPEKILRLLGES
jgi:hypothetical protein